MDKIIYGALKRIIEEVKEYRKLPTNMVGGNDIDLVEGWIEEVAKDEESLMTKVQNKDKAGIKEWEDKAGSGEVMRII